MHNYSKNIKMNTYLHEQVSIAQLVGRVYFYYQALGSRCTLISLFCKKLLFYKANLHNFIWCQRKELVCRLYQISSQLVKYWHQDARLKIYCLFNFNFNLQFSFPFFCLKYCINTESIFLKHAQPLTIWLEEHN